jgi:hypothetical protein
MWNFLPPAFKCYLGMLLICGLGISAPANATSDVELRAEVDDLISELNAKFGLNVLTKVSTECGLRVDGPFGESDRYEIEFCDREIAYFAGLPDQERPVEGLLTIIAHEYAHVLLDLDISDDAILLREASSKAIVRQIIQARAADPAFSKQMLEAYEWGIADNEGGKENLSEGQKISLGVTALLMLGAHENVDVLGVKLLHLVGRSPNTEVMKHLSGLGEDSDDFLVTMGLARSRSMRVGDQQALMSWGNYHCWGDVTSEGYVPTLRAVMAREGHSSLLAPFAQACGPKQVEASFQDLLDRYFPDI